MHLRVYVIENNKMKSVESGLRGSVSLLGVFSAHISSGFDGGSVESESISKCNNSVESWSPAFAKSFLHAETCTGLGVSHT